MTTKSNYSSIGDSLNIETEIISPEIETTITKLEEIKDSEKDYDHSRTELYALIKKGQKAIDEILNVAEESGSPRAYEVAGQLIKHVGDVTDKLLDLQRKLKELDEPTKKTQNTVNNALFFGSTAELSKIIKQATNLNNVDKE